MKQNLIDRAGFVVRAGNGGNGSVHFRREKYIPKGGPDGGDGGVGGSVILEVNPHVTTLRAFAGKDRFEAAAGGGGSGRKSSGKNAPDLVLQVPVGTVVMVRRTSARLLEGNEMYGEVDQIRDSTPQGGQARFKIHEETDRFGVRNPGLRKMGRDREQELERRFGSLPLNSQLSTLNSEFVMVADLREAGERFLLAKGGKGGRGNTRFKSSRMTTPKFAERGERGERFEVQLELKVLADVGLVGLPSVGKSTLLSVLTRARPEIAEYPFTTLSPNLGVLDLRIFKTQAPNSNQISNSKFSNLKQEMVIADIPGLIEGASEGKGLGMKFLKHVERCKVLVYVIAPTEEMLGEFSNANFQFSKIAELLWEQFEVVRREVERFGHGLVDKPLLVAVNKMDLIQDLGVMIQEFFEKKGVEVVMVSGATRDGLGELVEEIAGVVGSI